MSVLAFLVTELQSLASETRRKYPDVRDAAEKSLSILRTSPEQATLNLAQDGPQSEELLQPVFMGCSTRNPKVVAISLGSLHRLIAMKAVPQSTVPQIISTMAECMSQGVDVQLRILQTLLSLLTNFPEVHGPLLGDALLLCFKLQESRIAVVSSTAAATLRQLVMFVFDKVGEADRSESSSNNGTEETTLPDGTSVTLHPSARDAFSVFEDLCLLASSERPLFLKLESLPKTFSLELIESVLTNYHALFRQRAELLLLLRHHLCPMLHKSLSERPLFPLTLRSTRVVFLLLKQFSSELETEAEVFLTLLVKIVSGETDGHESARPHWMRVLAMEITRGLCSDIDLVRGIWERYDSKEGGSKVFSSLITALKRLATEKPSLLGVESRMFGLGVQSHTSLDGGASGYGIDVGTVAGMVASAANMVAMMGSGSGLSATSSMKLQCIDQLDKADSPVIPEMYIFLLALQSLVSLAEGLASLALPLYSSIVVQRPRAAGDAVIRAPPALDISSLAPEDPSTKRLRSVHGMLEDGWPAMLAALSFLISTNLSDELFVDVLGSMQNIANVAGIVGLSTPRDAFLTSLSKFSIPSGVVSSLNTWVEPATPRSAGGVLSAENLGLTALTGGIPQAPTLSDRNIACLKTLISTALLLAGSLGPGWFDILETLQNAEYVLFVKSPLRRSSAGPGGFTSKSRASSGHLPAPVPSRLASLSDLDLESVQSSISRLFDASKNLEDGAFSFFITALCKLSAEMVGMQSSSQEQVAQESTEDFGSTLTVPTSPQSDSLHRRRASGIHLSRSMRGGDYGISKLGTVSLMNIHRLIYRDPSLAWNTVTGHLLSVTRNSLAPGAIRLQAAEVLDEILVVVPRNISNTRELQADIQGRVLEVLSQQIATEKGSVPSIVAVDIRRLGLETLHQILQFSGHTLVVGWEMIFDMLSSVCTPLHTENPSETNSPLLEQPPRPRPTPLGIASNKNNAVLIRIAFQSLTLVCDSVDALSPEHLRLCISTLGQFGRQPETNMALTAAESLLWGVSDSIQSKRKNAEKEPVYSALWMFLLLELLGLCSDERPEVRNGAMQTLFRSLQLYGATLSSETWAECLDRVIFPLLDSVSLSISTLTSSLAQPSRSSQLHPPLNLVEGWDETKSLAFLLVGSIFNDFLVSQIMRLAAFESIWDKLVTHVTASSLHDHRSVSTAALKCLQVALESSRKAVDSELLKVATDAWERAWKGVDEIGQAITHQASATDVRVDRLSVFTQESLLALASVVRTTYSLSGASWDLSRIRRLLVILKDILTYSRSPEYRPDIDSLTPVQAAVTEALDEIQLHVEHSPSAVLADLADYATLAFVAAFDVESVPATDPSKTTIQKRVTYIALSKRAMPRLVEMYIRFASVVDIYNDGTLERVLSAYSIPIKLKYDCPSPSKFGSDQPLWKTATTSFLQIVRELGRSLKTFGDNVHSDRVEGTWRQVLDVFRGGLLADCSAADEFPLDVQDAEEKFDLSLIATLEIDVIPHLGDPRVSDSVIAQLSRTLQNASMLYDLTSDAKARSDNHHLRTNSEFSGKLDISYGSTAPPILLPRERFSYWCFDLLFLICGESTQDHGAWRQRVAALSIPSLLARCHAVLASYVVDENLRGNTPLPRIREEELLYVLRKIRQLKLWPGSLWAALSDDPSKHCVAVPPIDASLSPSRLIADATRRSTQAHLLHFYTLLYEIATVPHSPPSAWIPSPLPSPPARIKERPETKSETAKKSSPVSFPLGAVGSEITNDAGQANFVEVDARRLAKDCLREIGKEMGVEI